MDTRPWPLFKFSFAFIKKIVVNFYQLEIFFLKLFR